MLENILYDSVFKASPSTTPLPLRSPSEGETMLLSASVLHAQSYSSHNDMRLILFQWTFFLRFPTLYSRMIIIITTGKSQQHLSAVDCLLHADHSPLKEGFTWVHGGDHVNAVMPCQSSHVDI
jgi:hypothetical protein